MSTATATPTGGTFVRLRWWVGYATVLGVLAFAVSVRALRSYFVGDDFEGIGDIARGGPRFGSIAHADGVFRPVARLTLSIDHALWGLDPFGYHLTNLVGHVAVALAVAVLATRMTRSTRAIAALAGLVFVVSPVHSEAVTWIAGRGDVFTTLGCLLAMIAWLPPEGRPRTRRRRIAGIVAVAASVGVKESALVIPLLLAATEYWRAGRTGRQAVLAALRAPWPEYLVGLVFLIIRFAYRGNAAGEYTSTYGSLGWRTLAHVPIALVRSVIPGMSGPWWVVVGLAAGGALVAIVVATRGRPTRDETWLGACALLAIAPVAPLGVRLVDTGGERLVYLASAFTTILVVTLVDRCVGGLALRRARHSPALLALGAVVVIGAVALVGINGRWERAGAASEALVAGAGAWPTDRPVVLLSSVDEIDGAYVDRNALGAALVLVHGWEPPALPVRVLTTAHLRGADAQVRSRPVDCEDARLRCYEIAVTGDGSTLDDISPATGITPVRRSGDRVVVALDPSIVRGPVSWFSGTELRTLPSAAAPGGG